MKLLLSLRLHSRSPLRATLATSASLFTLSLQAQVAANPVKNDNETVVLSPFVVTSEGDTGYTAANSLMGGRINTALKDTPASVSVITRQFLDDIAATSPADVVEWTVNVAPNYVGATSSFSTYQYNIRNLGTSSATRNYVLWYGQSDDFNVDRYEFVRGPNGMIYGDSNIGGVPNNWTKRARFGKTGTVVRGSADTFGSLRATFDHNLVLNEKLAVRINAVHDEKAYWHDAPSKNFDGIALATTYRLTKKDEIRADGEFAYYTYPFFSNFYVDQGSYWNGTTSYNGVTAPTTHSAANPTGVVANPASFVYLPGAANGGLNQMGSYYRSSGTGLAINPDGRPELPNFPSLPSREFDLNPSNALSRLHQYFYNFAWTHRFSDHLTSEVAYARTAVSRYNGPSTAGNRYNEYRIDVNTVLPGGAPNPNYGKAYQDREVAKQYTGNDVTQLHGLINWSLNPSWVKQNFVGMVGTRLDRFDNEQVRLTRTNPPSTVSQLLNNAANIVLVRRYWDQAGLAIGENPVPEIAGTTLEYVPQTAQYQRKAVDFFQIASVSKFFKDRLSLMGGYRIDQVIDSQQQTTGIPVDARGLPQIGAVIVTPESPVVPRPVIGAKIHTNRKAASKNAGAVFWLKPWLGFVANYGESIASNTAGAAKLDGSIPGITRNEGIDIGLRSEFFSGRLSGSVSYYKNEQHGNLLGSANVTEINRLWDNIGRLDVPDVDYRDTQDRKGDGWEFEFVGNPTANWRMSLNFALPDSTILNIRPGLREYYNTNLPAWQAGANDLTNPQRAQIQTDINAIASTLNGLTPGTPVNDTYKYTANFYSTYSFRNGFLKNFEAGAGANFRGKNKIGAAFDDPYRFLYSPAYTLVSAHVSYRHKFSKKLTARFQINVKNLLDDDTLVLSSQDGNGYNTYRVGGFTTNPQVQVTDRFRQQDPRQFIFSTTFEF
ncbi:TonB-dependent siderophore receptor [Oleiharenicola lentus]|uniref:TonB-dependent siderophore receptor n=1 Tax=Oleiharenicola lentus TaxID=2508720 RepID=UPI003F672644